MQIIAFTCVQTGFVLDAVTAVRKAFALELLLIMETFIKHVVFLGIEHHYIGTAVFNINVVDSVAMIIVFQNSIDGIAFGIRLVSAQCVIAMLQTDYSQHVQVDSVHVLTLHQLKLLYSNVLAPITFQD